MEEEELKKLAAQLRQPHGTKGSQIGEMMHVSNCNMTRQAIKSLNISADEQVLELGHGNCAHLPYIMNHHKNVMYYGLEISELMYDEARQINKNYIEKNQAHFFMYDGADIPFGDNYFDKGYTVNTLYFWSEPEKLLAGIYRVMKPGGLFSIAFAQQSFMKQLPFTKFGFTLYDTKKAEALISKTDFKIAKTETQVEWIKDKTGGMINREFTIITMIKSDSAETITI